MPNHTQPMSAQVRFENVNVHYYSKPAWLGGKPFKALDQLDLNIETQNLAIVGPSGAGKSTMIELLFSLRRPTSGEVYICGQPLSSSSEKLRRALCQHIQLIPQEPQSSLNPYYTVEQLLLEPLISMGLTDNKEQKTEKALRDVGLNESLLARPSRQLSVGQAQRVAIARSLIVEPCVLVADEPTSSLDPVSRQQVLDLFVSIQQRRQMRLILVTHDLNAAEALCDEILVLDKGKVAEYGDAKQVMKQPKHMTTRALLSAQKTNHEYTKTIGEVSYAP
ncbi:dipeptide/oligopeptide/nickel ABC transporter ATP-binding protein [Vibrio fortis]|uniref:ABC transporter ATP-binding protein n=1 Tax=Vibrio fortis TaxID=212667 RepID=UPI002F3EF21C